MSSRRLRPGRVGKGNSVTPTKENTRGSASSGKANDGRGGRDSRDNRHRKDSDLLDESVYSFELVRPYPMVRSFVIKKPMQKALGGISSAFFEMLGKR